MRQKFGFTLSEILVALSIVGIIAAITIPATVSNHQRTALVLQLKKAYLDLEYSMTILKSENIRGDLLSSRLCVYSTRYNLRDFLTENYKIIKDCGETAQPCFANKYRSIDKTSKEELNLSGGRSILTQSGYAMYIIPAANSPQYAIVYIDVNGDAPPNIGGRDMYRFMIYKDYSIDVISPEARLTDGRATREEYFTSHCTKSYVGNGCLGKLINDDWKVNY